ncbi:hypothetical protein PAHAL_6G240000 [Panicum hallii]|uniref:Uncharacterized protein n=1 Tax=Panicum hallii TaxID=206008 RepID=A0A2S3I430_9POAL|nr:uncharacterized protein LOC112896657 [Panicum hallii]PAN35856.1 hypothetical protein PAHAL_6G240000 [Panicum hallii]
MATLTMQPIGPSPAPAAQEDKRKAENPAVDAADLSDIDSGWVVLKNSDIVSADLAAAAISGGQRLGSSTIPSWARWVIGGVVYTVVPFYNRVRQLEEETVGFVENTVEVVEHIAANVAKQLPEDGSLQKAVEEVEHLAEVVDADAEKVEAVTEKIDKVSDEIDAAVEPVIEELENKLDQGATTDNGANAQK